jgi:hypothetical protein
MQIAGQLLGKRQTHRRQGGASVGVHDLGSNDFDAEVDFTDAG